MHKSLEARRLILLSYKKLRPTFIFTAIMSDWWDNFANNLATDLAPLISLFGEAPTKQFLSECLNQIDCIIFAMAPLGIITTVISVVRVCGTPSLRAFIGRAQEGGGNAEAELCSSTSREVCELYNNGGIARVFGRPKLLEIVHDQRATNKDFYQTADLYLFKDYVNEKGKEEWIEQKPTPAGSRTAADTEAQPPRFAPNLNLSLNVEIKPHRKSWFIAAAVLGVFLQSAVLVWAALARYTFYLLRGNVENRYAVPLTVTGTVFLCTGIALCASLVEGSTNKRVFERAKAEKAKDDKDKSERPRSGNTNPQYTGSSRVSNILEIRPLIHLVIQI